jgi:hypothetical protein
MYFSEMSVFVIIAIIEKNIYVRSSHFSSGLTSSVQTALL